MGLEKIVFVIDNIDRCPKETAYELITNIKNFLGNKKKIIFVIPVDDEALKKHITRGGISSAKEAEEFLRKFFNVTLRIKPYKSFDLYDLSKSINDKNDYNLSPNSIDLISMEYATNPRRIIQFFNNLAAELEVFKNMYSEDFAKKNESLICKMLILREEWPGYYKVIAQKPALLNPNDERTIEYTEGDKNPGLGVFLNVTNSINQDISYEIIEAVLSAQDRNLKIPVEVLEMINKKEIPSIKSILENGTIDKGALLDVLIEKIEIGIQRRSYKLTVSNFYEIICHINSISQLTPEETRRLFERTRSSINDFIEFINDFNILSLYAYSIKNNFPYLRDGIVGFLKETVFHEQTEEKEELPTARRLLKSYIQSIDDLTEIKSLQDIFVEDYIRSNESVSETKISSSKFRRLVNTKLVSFVTASIKEISTTDEAFQEMSFITHQINLDDEEINVIIYKINSLHNNFANVQLNSFIGILNSINLLLENQSKCLQKPEEITALNDLYINTTGARPINGRGRVSLLSEISEASELSEKAVIIKFLFIIYKISSELINIQSSLNTIITRDGNIRDYLLNILIELKKDAFTLIPLRETIWTSKSYSPEHLELIKYLFELKGENHYLITDDEVNRVLDELIKISLEQSTEIISFLANIYSEPRVKRLTISIIEEFDRTKIVLLPAFLQTLAFDKISEGDNIYVHENDIDLLKLMIFKGEGRHQSKVVNVLVRKLMTEDQISIALDILEEAEMLSDEDIPRIQSQFSSIRDGELKKEAKEILANKSKHQTLTKGGNNKLKIIKAIYTSDNQLKRRLVTRLVRSKIENEKLSLRISNDILGGDPDIGMPKRMIIDYTYGNKRGTIEGMESEVIEIPNNNKGIGSA